MSFFDFLQAMTSNFWLYGGTFVLLLSILVFVHEWGHYIVARLCGVRVEEFSIGFGPELFGFSDNHGTRWKFSVIPLGGYVKMFGDTDPASAKHEDGVKDKETDEIRPLTPAERKVAFFAKPTWKRAAIVFAGPAINYIFAIIVMSIVFASAGQPSTPPMVAAIVGDSSAAEAGFEPHDEILSIDGREIKSFEDIRREMMIALDEEKHFVVQRGDEVLDIYAAPKKVEEEDRFGFKHSRGLLGVISPRNAISLKKVVQIDNQIFEEGEDEAVRRAVAERFGTSFTIIMKDKDDKTESMLVTPYQNMNPNFLDENSKEFGVLFVGNSKDRVMVKYGPVNGVKRALDETWNVTAGTLKAIGQIVTGNRSAKELGGVIRIGALAGDMMQQGMVAVILFMALLSINLGLINLFPIPLLDGGHLVFYAIEAIIRRPVPERVQEYAFRTGFVFLIGLVVFTNLNDILQLVL